jgi:hypothetical protein
MTHLYMTAGEWSVWLVRVSEHGTLRTWQLSRDGTLMARGSEGSEADCCRAAGRRYRALRRAALRGTGQ